MIHLKSVELKNKNENKYPFNIPTIKSFSSLEFKSSVTILVGENGTGKSTWLEGLAAAIGSVPVTGESIDEGKSFQSARELAKQMKLSWKIRTRRGFFLKAEDFINYTRKIKEIKEDTLERLSEIDEEYKDKSEYVKGLAKMPHARTLGEIKSLYGEGLHMRSHGESYLDFFQSRFIPNGLYILDEPETPLSPMRQLGFISILKDMIKENAQFIIATHSPIIMAFPEATIISFDEAPIKEVKYDDLEHVNLTKSFLNDPQQYLRFL